MFLNVTPWFIWAERPYCEFLFNSASLRSFALAVRQGLNPDHPPFTPSQGQGETVVVRLCLDERVSPPKSTTALGVGCHLSLYACGHDLGSPTHLRRGYDVAFLNDGHPFGAYTALRAVSNSQKLSTEIIF